MSQAAAARHLGMKQPAFSLLEQGKRRLTVTDFLKLCQLYRCAPGVLLGEHERGQPALPYRLPGSNYGELVQSLSALGFPGLPRESLPLSASPVPELVLMGLLCQGSVEPRVVEGLPWLLLTYPMDEVYLVDVARLNACQNRLGWVATVSRSLLENFPRVRTACSGKSEWVAWLEKTLSGTKLSKEDALSHPHLSEKAREFLRQHRPDFSRQWNLLDRFDFEDFARHWEKPTNGRRQPRTAR